MKEFIRDVLDSWNKTIVNWSKCTTVDNNESLLSHIGADIKVFIRVDITEDNEHGNRNYEAFIGGGWELYQKSSNRSTVNNEISNNDVNNHNSNESNNIHIDQTGDTTLEDREGYTQIIDDNINTNINDDYNDNPGDIAYKNKDNGDHDHNHENNVPFRNNSRLYKHLYLKGTVVECNWRDPSHTSQIAVVAVSGPSKGC
jgi:hypothetical protein